jgi:Holliday junction DNA helicase RuvA
VYHHLRGTVLDLSPTCVVIEAGGVGYDVSIPLSTFDRLKGKSEACVYTHLYVREDELRLYGFSTVAERELFRLLLSVSGVGPSIALAGLCALSPAEVAAALSSGDHAKLQRIKGVGRKLAERLGVELRERAQRLAVALGLPSAGDGDRGRSVERAGSMPARTAEALDAIAALVSLGFDKKSAESRVDAACRKLAGPDGSGKADVESLLKLCLQGG